MMTDRNTFDENKPANGGRQDSSIPPVPPTPAEPSATYCSYINGRRSVNPRPIEGSLKGVVLPKANVLTRTDSSAVTAVTAVTECETETETEADESENTENADCFEIAVIRNGKILKTFPAIIGETTLIRLVDFTGSVSSALSVEVEGDVNGDVSAGTSISVSGDVNGDVNAGTSVRTEGDVNGNAACGTDMKISGNVYGGASAGTSLKCGNIINDN